MFGSTAMSMRLVFNLLILNLVIQRPNLSKKSFGNVFPKDWCLNRKCQTAHTLFPRQFEWGIIEVVHEPGAESDPEMGRFG